MKLYDLYEMVDEIKSLEKKLDEMVESWNDGGIDSGMSDPGLQYDIEQEIENKLLTLKESL